MCSCGRGFGANFAEPGRDILSLIIRVTPATKKKIAIGFWHPCGAAGQRLGVFLLKRQQLLDYALGEVKTRVERKYPVQLTLGPSSVY